MPLTGCSKGERVVKNDILMGNEVVIRESAAGRINVSDGTASGGNLILTNLRIIYVITKHTEIDCVVPLSEVAKKADKFDIYSNTPNVVKIGTKSGMLYEFSVRKGEKSLWEKDMEKTISEYIEKYPVDEPELELEEVIEEIEEVEEMGEAEESSHKQEVTKTKTAKNTVTQIKTDASNISTVKSLAVIAAVAAPLAGIFFKHGFWIFLIMGMGFCYWDESVLHHSGYNTLKLGKGYLIPVYLFKRAKMLKTGMEYFVVWIVTFIIGVIGSFTNIPFWIRLFEAIQTMSTNVN